MLIKPQLNGDYAVPDTFNTTPQGLFTNYQAQESAGIFSWSPVKQLSRFLARRKERKEERAFSEALFRFRDTPAEHGAQREKDAVILTRGLEAHPDRNTGMLYKPVIRASVISTSPAVAALAQKIMQGNAEAEKYSFERYLELFSKPNASDTDRIHAAPKLQAVVEKHPEWNTPDLFNPVIDAGKRRYHPRIDSLLKIVVATSSEAAAIFARSVKVKRNEPEVSEKAETIRPAETAVESSQPVETPAPYKSTVTFSTTRPAGVEWGFQSTTTSWMPAASRKTAEAEPKAAAPFLVPRPVVEEPVELSVAERMLECMRLLSNPVSVHRSEVFEAVHVVDERRRSDYDRVKGAVPPRPSDGSQYSQYAA